MQYVQAKYEAWSCDHAFAVYTTDMLQSIGSTLGVKVEHRFYDILHPEQKDNRTGDEIVADVISRLGLEVKDNGFVQPVGEIEAG